MNLRMILWQQMVREGTGLVWCPAILASETLQGRNVLDIRIIRNHSANHRV
jgi:hypothetical protein